MSEKIPAKNVEDVKYIDLYQSADKIYTRKITGYFTRLRKYTGIPLLGAYLLIPWFNIDDRPAMYFNLAEREFHVFWMTFWPQDGMLLAWLLIIAAFSLFTVTTLVGRVWCGFTCPQTVWTLMFMWAENLCEGDRNARIKLDKSPPSFSKFRKKISKHAIWLAIAFVTGFTFVGYFVPIRELLIDFFTLGATLGAYFWIFLFTAATYGNAGFLREQVCKFMCPYARFQSVMYDRDTLTVSYDYNRGEVRGPRKPETDYKSEGLGDCIDCTWCVQVCPVDIDIRDGLQYACIDCGLCVDACDAIMDKMEYPRGLIRFTTEDALETGKTQIIRPKLVGYAAACVIMIIAFVFALADRVPLTLDVVRDRGQLYREAPGQHIENAYMLKINNMTDKEQTYRISLVEKDRFEYKGWLEVPVEPGETFAVPVTLSIPRDQLTESKVEVTFEVTSVDDESKYAVEQSTFVGPSTP